MISLIAALTGFISSLFPYLLQIIKDVSDKKHELAVLEKQIKIQKLGMSERLEEASLIAETSQFKELYATYKTNIKFVDTLNGLVRPIMAFAFFFLYVCIKYLQFSLVEDNAPAFLITEVLWSAEDQAIFAGIISFYFGQRSMAKFKKIV